MAFLQGLSLRKKSMKQKLMLAFALMSIIPLLILVYFTTSYIFSDVEGNMAQVSMVVLFGLWVAWAGYILAKEIIMPVISLSLETKLIAEGHYDTKILLERDDEIGDIASSVNVMTEKMRDYIGELQDYGKKTRELNVKIHRKVLTLTNLMKLGDIIASGAKFDEVADFAAEGMAGEMPNAFSVIYMKDKKGQYTVKAFFNSSGKDVDMDKIGEELPALEKLFPKMEHVVIDSVSSKKGWQKEMRDSFGGTNLIMFPLMFNAEVAGMIILGNYDKGAVLDSEDVEVVRAFEKEMVLAYQSSQVSEKVKKLESIDGLTGMYTYNYLKEQMDDEITRALYYQRPCSFMLIRIGELDEYISFHGMMKAERVIRQVSALLVDILPPVSKAARFEKGEFGVLLPELNKRESLEIAESIQEKMNTAKISLGEKTKVSVSIGVGENPIDGANAEEIITKARQYADKARSAGKNKVAWE